MDFYNENRAIDAMSLEEDGDMLLFQWGTYDWGNGKHFEIGLTRQLIPSGDEDVDIWQLQISYYYLFDEKIHTIDNGEEWCVSPLVIPKFRDFVLSSPQFTSCMQQSAKSAKLDWEVI